MEALIKEKLLEIEQRESCRILLAVESGSRAWGFASPDSDYDVRFIYVRDKDSYLKLNRSRDVIELPINDVLDINGWDVDKTLKLLHNSNPTVFEWFSSPSSTRPRRLLNSSSPSCNTIFLPKVDCGTICTWQKATIENISKLIWSKRRSTFMCFGRSWLAAGSLRREPRLR